MKLKNCISFSALLCAFIITTATGQTPPAKPPEHVRYYFVYRHLALLDKKAIEAERKGEESTRFRQHYKRFAALSDSQQTTLKQIGADCLRELAPFDARIKQLVAESRAKVPGGKLEPGAPLPQPNPELKKIEAERDKVMQRAYTRLRESFGAVEFKRFNESIEKSVRLTATDVDPRGRRPLKPPIPNNQGVK